jgi:signal transduction histidine kinase
MMLSGGLTQWLRSQWQEHEYGFATGQNVDRSSLLSSLVASSALTAIVLVPAFSSQLIHSARFPWLALAFALLSALASIGGHHLRGRPHDSLRAVLALFDLAFVSAAFALASALTVPPVCFFNAFAFILFVAAIHARTFTFTYFFALALCLPAIVVLAIVTPGLPVLLLWIVGCGLGIWIAKVERERRECQQQIQSLRTALTTTDQLATDSMDAALTNTLLGIGNFLHELRNAQASVRLSLEYLANADPADEDFQDALRDALSGNRAVHQLVDKIVDDLKSKRTAASRTNFWLREVVVGVASKPNAKQVVRVIGEIPSFKIDGDPDHLHVVLGNLARNSIQAGAKLVSISCVLEPNASAVIIEVKDDGPGLPAHMLSSLFRPFATYGKSTGTGLGLYLARRRVALMGGHIEGQNAPDGGAVFRLRLPGMLAKSKA